MTNDKQCFVFRIDKDKILRLTRRRHIFNWNKFNKIIFIIILTHNEWIKINIIIGLFWRTIIVLNTIKIKKLSCITMLIIQISSNFLLFFNFCKKIFIVLFSFDLFKFRLNLTFKSLWIKWIYEKNKH